MTMRFSTFTLAAALLVLACGTDKNGGEPAGGAGAGGGSQGGSGGSAGMSPRAGSGGAGAAGGTTPGGGNGGNAAVAGSGAPQAGTASGGGSMAGSGGMAPGGGGGGTASRGGRDAGSGGANGGRGGRASGGVPGGGRAGTAGTGASAGMAPSGGTGGSAPLGPLTVFIAGDSTVQNYTDTASTTDQAGWGQMLPALFTSSAKIDNRAIGGRTARRFIDEGHLDEILADIHAGDYLLVQFGTNDGNKTATYELNGQTIPYYLDPETDFKTYLQKYTDGAHQKQANIAFVTPPPRNSAYCTGGNGTGAHADAMRELGTDTSVPVLDLNKKSVDYLKAICPSPTPEDFFLLKSDGTVDGTHFQENGARILAGFVADEMRRVSLPLAGLLK